MGIDVEREGDADNKSNAVARGKRGGKKEAEKQESPCLALLVLAFVVLARGARSCVSVCPGERFFSLSPPPL